MKVDLLTIFPEFFSGPLDSSILKRAIQSEKVRINLVNIRDFARDKHKTTDDVPFGGGGGMVMMIEPLYHALESVVEKKQEKIIMTSAWGRRFSQDMAKELSTLKHLVLICGHYKGVDQRIKELFPMEEVSIGDYVLSGGEFASLVMLDAVVRLIPGVLGNFESAVTDSFYEGILGYPQYTRPAEFMGLKVPEVLLSGDHQKVRLWRKKQALKMTFITRPDLLEQKELSEEDRKLLKEI
ncbi:MAG: tRNA (guanine-N1)-methyltransferase [candidate division Zixibacteria bacterium SM23_73_2]|nr:MAG: tRNA (guanine-N1)-methyltransferase [candidate division Zixibacteria bacterium SM23_73_2]